MTTEGAPSEIRGLIDTLNRRLLALQQAGRAERNFIENAAHQLRTPLTGMLAHLELLAAEAGAEQRRRSACASLSRR